MNDGKETNSEDSDPKNIVVQHNKAVRWMHWINFPLIAIMIWSGFRIYWADRQGQFNPGIQDYDFQLFPAWFNESLNLESKLARGMAYHFTFGWLFIINGLLFTSYTAKSGHWKEIIPSRTALKDAFQVLLHDLKLSKKPLPEQGKYNAAQQIAYTSVLIMAFIAVLTGFAIYKPTQLGTLTAMFGGYESAKLIHFTVTVMLVLFFFTHILQVARAGWTNFIGMVTGYNKNNDLPAIASTPEQNVGEDRLQVLSRRNLLIGAGASLAGAVGLNKLGNSNGEGDRIPAILRQGHKLNENIWRRFHRTNKMAKVFPRSESSLIRVNGDRGIQQEVDLETWSFEVIGPDGQTLGTEVLADIQALPKQELTLEHKCVEGWSHVVTWGGTKFSEFIKKYEDEIGELPNYVNLESTDLGNYRIRNGEPTETLDRYYVSIDIETMMHPQTMLTYEVEGRALDQDRGAPLRLTTPLKYGIKQIKRIGRIEFSNTKGRDYWEERGYDWYSHL